MLIPPDGPAKVEYLPPFKFSEDGTVRVRAPLDQMNRALAEVKKSLARKGGRLRDILSQETLPPPEVHCISTEDFNVLRAGLLKTAYLAAFEYVGDPFLDDPLNAEWRRAIRTTTPTTLQARLKIKGAIMPEACEALFPEINPNQHAVAVFGLGGRLHVWLKLFGCPSLSLLCMASEVSSYGLTDLEGQLVICDASSSSFKKLPLHLLDQLLTRLHENKSQANQGQPIRFPDVPWTEQPGYWHKKLPLRERSDEYIELSVRSVEKENGVLNYKAEVEPSAIVPDAWSMSALSREHDSLDQAKGVCDRVAKEILALIGPG